MLQPGEFIIIWRIQEGCDENQQQSLETGLGWQKQDQYGLHHIASLAKTSQNWNLP